MIFILVKYRNFQRVRRLIEPPKKAGNGRAGANEPDLFTMNVVALFIRI
jgi:hypothetical protein